MRFANNVTTVTNLDITNKTKGNLPRLPFLAMKNGALGADYELSLVFVTNAISRKLNRERRGKDKPTNILSFPLDATSGEIFIDLAKAKQEAPDFERSYANFVAFLFIHGLMHLKGHDHGSTMERKEKALRKLFDI